MFATIKRKVYEQILADGRAQGREEGRSEAAQRSAKRSNAGRNGTGVGCKPRPGANGLRNRRPGSSGQRYVSGGLIRPTMLTARVGANNYSPLRGKTT